MRHEGYDRWRAFNREVEAANAARVVATEVYLREAGWCSVPAEVQRPGGLWRKDGRGKVWICETETAVQVQSAWDLQEYIQNNEGGE